MSDRGTSADAARRDEDEGFLNELTGFGAAELRTTRDLVLRPGAVLDAYDAHGRNAGGRYAPPLRYLFTIVGAYLLLVTLLGGYERTFATLFPQEMIAPMVERSGKSADAFAADLEQWFSLFTIPVMAACMSLTTAPLFRKWSGATAAGGRRQCFAFISGWELYGAPFGIANILWPNLTALLWPVTFVIVGLLFARMGRGRWWRTAAGAWLKGALLAVVTVLTTLASGFVAGPLVFAAATFLP